MAGPFGRVRSQRWNPLSLESCKAVNKYFIACTMCARTLSHWIEQLALRTSRIGRSNRSGDANHKNQSTYEKQESEVKHQFGINKGLVLASPSRLTEAMKTGVR